MSLHIPGVQRLTSVAPRFLTVCLAVSMMFLVVPKASAVDDGVRVSPGETSCYYMHRRILNLTADDWVAVTAYEVRNGVREDYPEVHLIAPRGELFVKTDDKRYFQHALGVKTVVLAGGPTGEPVGEWTDWQPADYVPPADCPPMVTAPKIQKRTAKLTLYRCPTIWVNVQGYRTDLGYRVGKSKKIQWKSTGMDAGYKALYGPSLKRGKRTMVRFYYRNRDDSGRKTKPTFIRKMNIKRL